MSLTAEQERLVVENLRLTNYVAYRFETEFFSKEDLIGFGTIGLIKASKSFDGNKGYKFSSLAFKSIQNEILRVLRKKRISAASIDETLEDDSETTLSEVIADEFIDPTEYMDLQQAFELLNERDLFIIKRLFGFDNWYMTHGELADCLGISKSRIGQLKDNALKKIKIRLEKEGSYL